MCGNRLLKNHATGLSHILNLLAAMTRGAARTDGNSSNFDRAHGRLFEKIYTPQEGAFA
jgi:hypothetical protein